MSRTWLRQKERSSLFWLRLIRWIALSIGRPVARLLLLPIAGYFLLFSIHARRASRSYLHRVFGRRPSLYEQFQHFHTFSATILDRVYLLTDNEQLLDIRVHHADVLDSIIEEQRGCILLGAHLGSFEVLRSLAVRQKDIRLKVLMYPQHNETITRLLSDMSPEIANTVIPLGGTNTLLKVKEYLDQGYLIGILGDRVAANDKTINCKLLGDDAEFPLGPMLLAASLRAPVVFFCGLYRGENRYDIYFELLDDLAKNPGLYDRRAVTAVLVEQYAERIEHYLKLAPYNWFNFYDYWQKS